MPVCMSLSNAQEKEGSAALNRNGFRWTRLCVSATTALITGCAWNTASASQTHTLQHGETLASLARQYHVSVQDIVNANGISHPDSVPDGRKLIIPDPPKRLVVPVNMNRKTQAKSDRVNVRLGPSGDYRAIWMFDLGSTVTVTAEKDGWAQVALPDGRNGWVRQEFLKSGGNNLPVEQANNSRKPAPAQKPAPIVALAPDTTRRNASVKPAGASAGASKKSHEAQHPPKVVHNTPQHPTKAAHSVAHVKVKEQAAHHSSHSSHTAKTAQHAKHEEARKVAHHSSSGSRHASNHAAQETGSSDGDSDIVRTAYAYRGTPYRYGSSGRGSFDCSGFTSYLYSKKGVSLPHSAKGQFQEGHQVSRGELKAGDLVFFHTVTSGISHVGMYVGDGKFVHCSSRRSGGVRVDNLDSGYYSKAYRGARRVK